MLRKIDSRIKRKNQYESNSNQPDQGFYLTLITNWNQTSNRHVNTIEKKTSFQSTIFFNKRLPTHFIHNTLIINKYYFIVSSVRVTQDQIFVAWITLYISKYRLFLYQNRKEFNFVVGMVEGLSLKSDDLRYVYTVFTVHAWTSSFSIR